MQANAAVYRPEEQSKKTGDPSHWIIKKDKRSSLHGRKNMRKVLKCSSWLRYCKNARREVPLQHYWSKTLRGDS